MTAAGTELARLVRYVHQAISPNRITMDAWTRVVALERRWFAPSRSRGLFERARATGLLRTAGIDAYEAGPDARHLELPLDYRPNAQRLEGELPSVASDPEAAKVPLFRQIVSHLAEAMGAPESEIVARINATQQSTGGLVSAEVAALCYGRLNQVDVDPFLALVHERVHAAHAQK